MTGNRGWLYRQVRNGTIPRSAVEGRGVAEFMDSLDEAVKIEFSEAGAMSPAEWFRYFLGEVYAAAEPPRLFAEAARPTMPRRKPAGAAFAEAKDDDGPAEWAAEKVSDDAGELISEGVEAVKSLVDGADSLTGLREKLFDLYPDMPFEKFAGTMSEAMMAAKLAGMLEVENGD